MAKNGALLVGFGEMGKDHHLRTLKRVSGMPVVGIVRGSSQPVDSISTYTPDQLEDALQWHKPKLAVVSTPHDQHYEQVKLCLSHGCHVLCEKPLALEIDQCEELIEVAKSKQRHLVVNLQRRLEGPAQTYRKLRGAERLGEIRAVYGIFYHRFATESLDIDDWRQDPNRAGAGVIEDSGCHMIDLLACFADSPMQSDSLQAMADCGTLSVPQMFSCMYKTQSGCMVTASVGYRFPANAVQEEITIIGTKGSLFIRRFRPKWNQEAPEIVYVSDDGQTHESIDIKGAPRGRALPLEQVLAVIQGRQEATDLRTRAEDVLESHKIIHAIKQKAWARS